MTHIERKKKTCSVLEEDIEIAVADEDEAPLSRSESGECLQLILKLYTILA